MDSTTQQESLFAGDARRPEPGDEVTILAGTHGPKRGRAARSGRVISVDGTGPDTTVGVMLWADAANGGRPRLVYFSAALVRVLDGLRPA